MRDFNKYVLGITGSYVPSAQPSNHIAGNSVIHPRSLLWTLRIEMRDFKAQNAISTSVWIDRRMPCCAEARQTQRFTKSRLNGEICKRAAPSTSTSASLLDRPGLRLMARGQTRRDDGELGRTGRYSSTRERFRLRKWPTGQLARSSKESERRHRIQI
ncbi:hypothetical protein DENSPDRAFT_708708 [Dentipellis sp. KUC8613]|nr:hypothetical protein DENSPDRAFT_708708 [Dentipellis sp. KUC8613]